MSRSDWSLSDWFHCNNCYRQYSLRGDDPSNKFLFTSCGHIYCASCAGPDTAARKCKLCGSVFKTMILSKSMRPDIQMYFQDPKTLIRKGLEILKFQGSHQRRLLAHRSTMPDPSSRSEKEILILREEVAYLKRILAEKQQRSAQRSPLNMAHVSPRQHNTSYAAMPPPNISNAGMLPPPNVLSNAVRYNQPVHSAGHGQHAGFRKSPFPLAARPVSLDEVPRRPPGRITITTPPYDAKRGTVVPSPGQREQLLVERGERERERAQPMDVQCTPRQSPTNRPRPGYMSVAHPLPSFSPMSSPAQSQSPVRAPQNSAAAALRAPLRNVTNVIAFTPGVVRETSLSRFKAAADNARN